MDTINELNPRSCRAYFQRAGESEYIIPVSLGQDHFQYRLKLLEIENVRERKIAAACPSGIQAMIADRILTREGAGRSKVLKDGMLAWQEI
jgi:rhodanese-related sulfurtransferase